MKRFLAYLLSALMIISLVPASAITVFAVEMADVQMSSAEIEYVPEAELPQTEEETVEEAPEVSESDIEAVEDVVAETEESETQDDTVLFEEDGTVAVTKVVFETTKMNLAIGSSKTLAVSVLPEEAGNKELTWTSADDTIASVDSDGVITAHSAGKVKITATSNNGKTATCTVTTGEPATYVEFTSLKTTSVAIDKTLTLKAKAVRDDKVKPVSANVTYEIISGEDFATIDAKGKLKGIAYGEVVVRATAEAGTEEAYTDVTIKVCKLATKVTLDTKKAVMVTGGEDLHLNVTTLPEDNTDTITWTSSNEEVATVDNFGVVTAHKSGSTKITAASGSGKSATCSITVGAPADAVEFTSLKSTSLAVGKNITLKAKAFCTDGGKPVSTAVKLEIISGEEFATIDEKGKLVGVGIGKVVVRATAEAGTEEAFADVTINVCIPATKVTLNTTKAVMVTGGDTLQLEATMLPAENSDNLTWKSSNEEIAIVDENGFVTSQSKSGSVKITATSGSGKSATCTITVGAPANAVEFTSLKSTSLAVGKTLTLKAKAYCTDGSKSVSTAVTFDIISGEEFATIDEKGKLTAISTGDVTVRATAVAGTEEAYADITISICIPVSSIKFNESKITIALGEPVKGQEPILNPEDHTDTIRFYSSDETIVKIDEDGNLIPVSIGSAKINFESGSGKKGSYTVNVVYPEGLLVLDMSSKRVKAGIKTVTLDIMVANNPGIAGITMNLEFDDSVLEVVSVSKGAISSFSIVPGMGSASPFKILAVNMQGNNVTDNGRLLTVTFNILDDAPLGTYDIAINSNNEDEKLFVLNQNGDTIDHVTSVGSITIY